MNANIQLCIDNGLITYEELKSVESYLSVQLKNNNQLVTALLLNEVKKLTGGWFPYMTFGEVFLTQVEQQKVNSDLLGYLAKIRNSKLISDVHFECFQNRINDSQYVDILGFLGATSKVFELDEYMAPDKLKLFANKLYENAIVSEAYDKLLVDIDSHKIEYPLELINYCDRAAIINELYDSSDTRAFLELVHRQITSLLPELDFTNFTYLLLPTVSFEEQFVFSPVPNIRLSMRCNDRTYLCDISYSCERHDNSTYRHRILDQGYYKIFNKVLLGLGYAYRLFEIYNPSHILKQPDKVGVIVLNQKQVDSLSAISYLNLRDPYLFNNGLKSTRIEQAVTAYQRIGLFSHLSAFQIELGRSKALAQDNSTLNDVLGAFPGVGFTFELEQGYHERTYMRLLNDLKTISGGGFNPIDIVYGLDANTEEEYIAFKLGSQLYTKVLYPFESFIDTSIIDFVNAVALGNELKWQIYKLYNSRAGVSVIYLNEEQYGYLKHAKLLLFEDDYPEPRIIKNGLLPTAMM